MEYCLISKVPMEEIDLSDQCMEDATRLSKKLDKKELVIPLLYLKAFRSFTGVSWNTCILSKIICYIYEKKMKRLWG